MSYSDEPNVISEQKRSRKPYFLIAGVVLFIGLLASVAFFPRIFDFQRRNTPVGPNGGSLYFISFEGARYSMELARSPALDYHLAVVIQPASDRTSWNPEEYHVRFRVDEDEPFEVLEWHPEEKFFGMSEERYHPMWEARLEIELKRGEETVWSGRRWSFRVGGGHGH